jgi:hypothetical protein
MPLARYFSFVGGVLLALLFILDAYLPKIPVHETADPSLPVIRIHSERKWPERIVFDTSVPTIVPAQIASSEQRTPLPGTASDVSVKERGREALAQMQPSDTKQLQPSSPKKRELHVGAAVAIWLVWPESLARGLIGAAAKRRTNSGLLIKVRESSQGKSIAGNDRIGSVE